MRYSCATGVLVLFLAVTAAATAGDSPNHDGGVRNRSSIEKAIRAVTKYFRPLKSFGDFASPPKP
jgi:hypothetical protein